MMRFFSTTFVTEDAVIVFNGLALLTVVVGTIGCLTACALMLPEAEHRKSQERPDKIVC